MLACAIDKLDQYDGTNPPKIKQALEDNYGGANGTIFGSDLKFILS